MKFCYANRRMTLYPNSVDPWDLAPEDYTDAFLTKVKEMGFDALEIGSDTLDKTGGSEKSVKEFTNKVKSFGLDIGCIRSGGTLTEAKNGPENIEKIKKSIIYGTITGAEVVNGAISAPIRYPGSPEGSAYASSSGWPKSQDSSKEATMWIYEHLSKIYQDSCDQASDNNINVSAEIHQNSPVDNSWSAKYLYDLVDRSNFGINPDLGNVLWNYDQPEEKFENCIDNVASISNYWHCKNLHTVYHPENQRSVFLRVPLQDGEIDYRYAITSMKNAGYKGYMAIEGTQNGDQFYKDYQSISYAKSVIKSLDV